MCFLVCREFTIFRHFLLLCTFYILFLLNALFLLMLSQVLALRTFVLTVCYLRLVCIGLSASYVTLHRDVFLLFAVLAHALDILGRSVRADHIA